MVRYIFSILLLLISITVNATEYYIAPTTATPPGSDSNAGTIASPWLTLTKAWTAVNAGDIIYLRGGTYTNAMMPPTTLLQNKSGIAGNYIKIYNYPGESPLIDYSDATFTTQKMALRLINTDYIHIKGLHIRNMNQPVDGSVAHYGLILWSDVNNCIFENLEIDHIGGWGVVIGDLCNNNTFKYVDSHHNSDRYTPEETWGWSDGFETGSTTSTGTTFIGCRAYWNSDDGWDLRGHNGTVTIDSCWSFLNGYQPGEKSGDPDIMVHGGNGEGFKLGPKSNPNTTNILRTLTNCLVSNNYSSGFSCNTSTGYYFGINIFNCTSFGSEIGYGFHTDSTMLMTLRNNISYNNLNEFNDPPVVIHDHNSFDIPITVTDEDFVSIDSTQLWAARSSNGNLPEITYLHLASTSDLIDAGTNVYLPYSGLAPDLGAFEYNLPVATTGLGWEDHLAKRNFKDDVNFAGRWMIDAIPVTATAAELNALVGQGQIISGLDTIHLSNRINSKADTSLSNLSSVAINTHLLPATSGSANLGSALLPFGNIYANGTVSLPSTTSIGTVDATELSYVNGVTFAIQTQLNNKADTAGAIDIEEFLLYDAAVDTLADLSEVRLKANINSPSLTGTPLAPTAAIGTNTTQIATTAFVLANSDTFDSTYVHYRIDSLVAAFTAYKAIVDPLLPPYFVSAEVGTLYSDTIVVTLSKNVVADSIPSDEAFMFTEGVGEIDVTNVTITDNKIYLALASTPQADSTLLLDYTKPSAPAVGLIQDADGSKMPSFVNSVVTNNGIAGPTFVSAEIGTYNDSIIAVKISRDLLADSTAAVANFTVSQGVTTKTIQAITISNDTVYIALQSIATGDSTYTVTYTRGPKYLQDASGYYVPSWTAQSVTNNITPLVLNDAYTKGWYINDTANFTWTPADSLVTQWNDMSGNANHLLQPSGTDIPKYMGSVGVHFDGVDDWMYDASFSGEDTLMIYAVMKIASFSAYEVVFKFANTGFIFQQPASGTNNLKITQGANSVTTGNSFFSTSNYYVLRLAWNNAVSSGSFIRLNEGTATSGTLADAATSYLYIGSNADVAEMYIKELIIRSKVDSAGDQTSIVNYLNTKYLVY